MVYPIRSTSGLYIIVQRAYVSEFKANQTQSLQKKSIVVLCILNTQWKNVGFLRANSWSSAK